MAASLLRLGRMGSVKCLQVDSWVTLKKRPALWFCTQANEPKKPVKKTKAAGKTAEAPDERAALLAYKTAVSFPVRLSESGGFPLGGTEESVTADSAQLATDTAASVGEAAPPAVQPLAEVDGKSLAPEEALGPAGAPDNATTASPEPKDTAADESSSSSSSSDSDSDSDSDSEETETRNILSEFAEPTPGVAKGTTDLESEVPGAAQHPGRGPGGQSAESEETGSEAPADVVEHDASSVITETHKKTPPLHVVQAETPVEPPVEPAEVSEESQREAAARPVETESAAPKAAAEAEGLSTAEDLKELVLATAEDLKDPVLASAEATAEELKDPILVSTEATVEDLKDPVLVSAEATAEELKDPVLVSAEATAEELKDPVLVSAEATVEELKDPVLVSAEATGEDLLVETAAEQFEEPAPAAAAAPPEPEELCDNSTYKNYQHHSYNTYTFVDLDVDMAKYRLPQPSSGRPSPQH